MTFLALIVSNRSKCENRENDRSLAGIYIFYKNGKPMIKYVRGLLLKQKMYIPLLRKKNGKLYFYQKIREIIYLQVHLVVANKMIVQ